MLIVVILALAIAGALLIVSWAFLIFGLGWALGVAGVLMLAGAGLLSRGVEPHG